MFEKLREDFSKIIDDALGELEQHRWLVFLLIILSLVQVVPYVAAYSDGALRVLNFYLFLVVGLILLALAHKYTFFVVCLFLSLANLFYLHISRHWGDKHLESRIEAALESPPSEALEYLQSHIDTIDTSMILFFTLYAVLLVYFVFLARFRPVILQKIAIFALAGWLLVFAGFRVDKNMDRFPPYRLAANIVDIKERYKILKGRRDFLAQHPLKARECNSKYDKILFVIGESAFSDHMSIFGYTKATTPFAVQSKPYAFDALAPSNQTRHALPMMLTSAKPGNFDIFFEEHSLVSLLRACGFHTLWISNQGRMGSNDSYSSSLAFEADEQIFLNQWKSTETSFDERIVHEIDARAINNRPNHATFVHLIGSHVQYNKRFPENYGFTDLSDRVAQYDNSILYSDFVLSELYKRFYDESLLFIYVSDTGQVVSNTRFGSGFSPAYKEEYRVPLLIWTSDSVAIEKIRSEVGDLKINTHSIDNIVQFLIGYSTSTGVSTARHVSVLTPEYVREYDDLITFDAN